MENIKILLIDENTAIQNLITRFFSYQNYTMAAASDAKTGREIFQKFRPNLVILDIHLPDENGFQICKDFAETGVMIVILTDLTDHRSMIEGFKMGADDYVTKPFNLEILQVRINALLKRQRIDYSNNNHHDNQTLILDNLTLDLLEGKVEVNNQTVFLTGLELKLLHFLATHPNQVLHRSELLTQVWQEQNNGDFRKVDVHIGQIRKKIGDHNGELIQTIRGKGYRLELA
jgi:DNA-binding response OmpR family regulator